MALFAIGLATIAAICEAKSLLNGKGDDLTVLLAGHTDNLIKYKTTSIEAPPAK